MAIVLKDGRQNSLVGRQTFVLADLPNNTAVKVAKMPSNSIVTGGFVVITEVFNSATTDVLDIGHSDDDDEYSPTPIAGQALGLTALTRTGYVNTGGLDVIATRVSTGAAATTGKGYLVLEYIIIDRATEVQTT